MPPEIAKIRTEQLRASQLRRSFIDRHHLYFPKYVFRENGALATEFREHRFNSVWLPRVQHERLHRRYQKAVEQNPSIFVPDDDVMIAFLDEAKLLDDLEVCVSAIAMMDRAIYEEKVKFPQRLADHRNAKIEHIQEVSAKASSLEIIHQQIARSILESAQVYLAA